MCAKAVNRSKNSCPKDINYGWVEYMEVLAILYAIALFLIIAPIAYIMAYLFHHGMMPPVV